MKQKQNSLYHTQANALLQTSDFCSFFPQCFDLKISLIYLNNVNKYVLNNTGFAYCVPTLCVVRTT